MDSLWWPSHLLTAIHLRVCWPIQLAALCWVHFLWLAVTILVTATDSWWVESSLLGVLEVSGPNWRVCDADYSSSETGPEAVWIRQTVSLAAMLSSRGSPVSLAETRGLSFLGTWAGLCRHWCHTLACLAVWQRERGRGGVWRNVWWKEAVSEEAAWKGTQTVS